MFTKNIVRGMTCICLFLMTGVVAYAQRINTVNGSVTVQKVSVLNRDQGTANNIDGSFSFYAIATFAALPDDQKIKLLHSKGVSLVLWVEKSTYIVKINNPETFKILTGLNEGNSSYMDIISIGNVPDALKFSNNINRVVSAKDKTTERLNVSVTVYERKFIADLKSICIAKGINIIVNKGTDELMTLSLNGVNLSQLAVLVNLNYVKNIEQYNDGTPKEMATPNLRGAIDNQIYAINYDTANGYVGRNTYSGNVETVSSDDPEILTRFRNRLALSTISYQGDMGSHARASASVMAGGNNFDEVIDRGIAPGTKGLVQAYWDPSLVLNNYNSGFHPLSINSSLIVFPTGQVNNSPYTGTTAAWDDAVRSVPDLMFAVSSGNNGGDAGLNGYPAGWNNIAYNSSAKNIFAVSNISYPGKTSFGCSGPFNDGRLAPQICAEGNGGTSFSSPALAGFVSDLYEVYMDVYHTTVPRSDVVKAVIMNTAQDIYKKGPDFKSGYGSINPYEAVKAIKEKKIITGTVAQGSSATPDVYTVAAAAGLKQLRVLLYWHDFKAAPNAVKALVNDLDLKVVTPAGDTILPWVLNSAPAHVTELAVRGIDTLNNQEQVTIENPDAGNYKFLVYGKQVPMGPQDYAITYMLNPYHIKITTANGYRLTPRNYVSGKSRIPGSEEITFGFTWDYALNTDNASDSIQVFLQRQAGEPFIQLGSVSTRSADNIIEQESAPVGFYFQFNVPADFPVTSTARVIVKQKNQPYADTSGYLEYTPMPQHLKITSACPEKITLQWDPLDSLHAGGKYIIYRLGQSLMESVDSVDANHYTATLQAANVLGAGNYFANEEWFAVAARQPDGSLSYRTYPVTQRITNTMSPNPVESSFALCKADTAVLSVDSNYTKDSVRWFKNGLAVSSGGNKDTLRVPANEVGKYTYRSYLASCAFESDTFYVNKSSSDIASGDTVFTDKNIWRAYVYKGDYSAHEIYGYFDMTKTEFNLNTADYFSYANANPWTVANYVGCPLAVKDFTMIIKRNGLPSGNYDIKARKGYKFVKLWINDTLVYTAPENLNSLTDYPVVWSGKLDMNSRVRIELRSVDVSAVALDFVPDRYTVNLALRKHATQPTTWPGAEVEKALDGDYADISSTVGGDSYPYINIDLGDSAAIDYFHIWNRSDNKGVQLCKYYVFVSGSPFEEASTDPSLIAARPGMKFIYRTDTAQKPTTIAADMKGRYIRLQLSSVGGSLSLSEFEAFGSWLSPDSGRYKNLAYQQSATQSSTYLMAVASRAVDGVTDGDYGNGSVSHTSATTSDMVNPWWQVDLGNVYHIKSIRLYNRNTLQDRVKDYNIIISETPLNMSTSTTDYPGATIIHRTDVVGTPTTITLDVQGRYVALQIPGTDKIINLAEVQVFGTAAVDSSQGTLPLKFGSFTAASDKQAILLKWSTLMEHNTNSFDIERLDNTQFRRIGSVSAKGLPSDYIFKDASPQYGINHYRLKEYDKDGSFLYSAIRSATYIGSDKTDIFIIQPNPIQNILGVLKPVSFHGRLEFTIINVSGRKLLDWSVDEPSGVIQKNVSFLKPGIYFLRIGMNNGTIQTLKFIKN